MQVEELRKLNTLLKKATEIGCVDDLDEIGYNLPEKEMEELRALIKRAAEEDFIKTWIENGRGISFTGWTWNYGAYKIANKHRIELIDPGEW